MTFLEIFNQYFELGFTHVIPLGFDHILFILSIFFLNSDVKSVLIQCFVFTIAHSISLGLTASGALLANSNIIEPLIAISILYTSIENIILDNINKFRLIIIFLFGLIHGMGFASALKENGLPPFNFLEALLSFNIGVEIGQITIILFAYFFISKWLNKKEWYKNRIVYPISTVIGCIAIYLTIERIFY
jgi:hypothetical protein